jgi:hypothetical protein
MDRLVNFEQLLTGSDEELHKLAIDRDYGGFAIRRMTRDIPLMGGAVNLDVARYQKKNKT